jgi:hypothetical protein
MPRGERASPEYPRDTVRCTATVAESGPGDGVAMEAIGVNQADAEVLRARFSGVPTDVRLAR